MCIRISLLALKISNSSLSGSILINLQSSSCSIATKSDYGQFPIKREKVASITRARRLFKRKVFIN